VHHAKHRSKHAAKYFPQAPSGGGFSRTDFDASGHAATLGRHDPGRALVLASLLDPGERDKLSLEPQLPTDGTLEEFLGQFAALDEAESGLLRGRNRRGSVASGSRRGSAREGVAGAWGDGLTARSDANPGCEGEEPPHTPHSPSRLPSLAWDGAGGD
jgi:hypothetical protein